MSRTLLLWGSINALLAVALGAFGAHGLKHIAADAAWQTWATAAQYHFYHALALLLIGILVREYPRGIVAGRFMLAGIVLFSGSLYLLALTQIKILGVITPLGGVCFLLGWLWLVKIFWPTKRA
ncbi:MAG: DUF423 domain-containing protein [Gammaproteobacteria bacterium]|jgi:uncharacterized membrane protein YgdD (TMEM256/DUF423 family)|nr:DUF423 domain-containing protein [Gammaproteobacteria bacterium]